MPQRRRQEQARGTVVALRSFGESDRIVELLTARYGRISALARGGRASRRRFSGALDSFVELDVQLIATGSLWTLSAADVVTTRYGIRARLDRFRRASLVCECVRALCAEQEPAALTAKAVSDSLDLLDQGQVSAAAGVYRDLLAVAGILPDATRCTGCGAQIGSDAATLGSRGRVLCGRCAGPSLSDSLARALWSVLAGRSCDREETAQAFERWAISQIEEHLGRSLRSRVVL